MFEILRNEKLNDNVFLLEISAPLIAKKVMPGQFIMLRVDEKGERIPPTESLIILADFYGTSMDYLMGRTNEKKPYPKSDAHL